MAIHGLSGFSQGLASTLVPAIQRRLEERRQQPEPMMNLMDYLPEGVGHSLFPGQEQVNIPAGSFGNIYSPLLSWHTQASKPTTAQMPGSWFADTQQAAATGDWSEWVQKYGDVSLDVSEWGELWGGTQSAANVGQRMLDQTFNRLDYMDQYTPITREQAMAEGLPMEYVGRTPNQVLVSQGVIAGTHAQDRHFLDMQQAYAQLQLSDEQLTAMRHSNELNEQLMQYVVMEAAAKAQQATQQAQFSAELHPLAVELAQLDLQQRLLTGEITQAEFNVYQQSVPHLLRQLEAQTASAEAGARVAGVDADVAEQYGLPQAQAQLDYQQLANQRAQFDLAHQQQLAPHNVSQAASAAGRSALDLQFAQDTYPDRVRREAAETDFAEGRLVDQDLGQAQARVDLERSSHDLTLAKRWGNLNAAVDYYQKTVGVQQDEAELRQTLQLIDPIVSKAIADAQRASVGAEIDEATKQSAISMAQADLDGKLISNEIDRLTYDRASQLLPLEVEQATEQVATMRVDRQAREFSLEIERKFAESREIGGLANLTLRNMREATGLEMDQAQLDRFNQLTEPVLAEQIARASLASTEALLSHETYEDSVQTVRAHLDKLLQDNKISREEHGVFMQMAPAKVQQAYEQVYSMELENEARELDNEYARESLNDRLSLVSEQAAYVANQNFELENRIQQLQWEMAIARRNDPLQLERLQVELETAKTQQQQLQFNLEQSQATAEALFGLDPNDRDFAFKMYQAEVAPFKGTGMWTPSFADYVANLTSDNRVDWNQYVTQYDAEMRSMVGDFPATGDELPFEWMKPDIQRAHKNAADIYFSQFGYLRMHDVNMYPPVEIWYSNYTSDAPLHEDELVQAWNMQAVPDYIMEAAYTPTSMRPTQQGSAPSPATMQPREGMSAPNSAEEYAEAIVTSNPSLSYDELAQLIPASTYARVQEMFGLSNEQFLAVILDAIQRRGR